MDIFENMKLVPGAYMGISCEALTWYMGKEMVENLFFEFFSFYGKLIFISIHTCFENFSP